MEKLSNGLIDTSVLISLEQDRQVDASLLPDTLFVSVVSFAELQFGVYAAESTAQREVRLATLMAISEIEVISIDREVAKAWGRMTEDLRQIKKRIRTNDGWIAATALAHKLPIVTQDNDYDNIPNLEVIKV